MCYDSLFSNDDLSAEDYSAELKCYMDPNLDFAVGVEILYFVVRTQKRFTQTFFGRICIWPCSTNCLRIILRRYEYKISNNLTFDAGEHTSATVTIVCGTLFFVSFVEDRTQVSKIQHLLLPWIWNSTPLLKHPAFPGQWKGNFVL